MSKFRSAVRILARSLAAWALCACAGAAPADVPAASASASGPVRLRVLGGLASGNQYTRHEQPFWASVLPARSGGRVTADIAPFDQAGIRGQEVLRLMQGGMVPFGTALLGVTSSSDPEWAAPDLAALDLSMADLKRLVQAFRPYLAKSLHERYGIELLTIYVYPAQVLFCKKPFARLTDLAGRRIRTATPAQSDFVEGLKATPVRTSFADLMTHMRSGNAECAITGTMSGNVLGLHEVTTHVSSLPVSWGLSIFGANEAAWKALPDDVRALLGRELPKLEEEIWAAADRETTEGIACNTGAPTCVSGRKGTLVEVKPNAADEQLMRQLFTSTVLPRWVDRCGPSCTEVWNTFLKPATRIEAPNPR